MFALRKATTTLSMMGRRCVTNAASGTVTPWFNMLKKTPAEKALKNPLVPVGGYCQRTP